MNKLHILALVGLIFSGANNASMMGQEQREVLYTLHMLGQDFVNVPMITQNIDMFMGILEMNIQLNEIKLKAADQKIKDALWKNAALFTGVVVGGIAWDECSYLIRRHLNFGRRAWDYSAHFSLILSLTIRALGQTFATLNIYDAWKTRSALVEALALDKEIFGKLQEIKDSMDFIGENADFDDNIVANDAE